MRHAGARPGGDGMRGTSASAPDNQERRICGEVGRVANRGEVGRVAQHL